MSDPIEATIRQPSTARPVSTQFGEGFSAQIIRPDAPDSSPSREPPAGYQILVPQADEGYSS